MWGHIPRHRVGAMVSHTKAIVGSIDRGIRTAHHVFKAVKAHVPDGKIKRAAEKGLSDYESVREKIRSAAPPL